MRKPTSKNGQSGMALFAVLAALVPLIILVTASTDLLRSRSKSVASELDQEKALLAAESGIDYVVHKANCAALVKNQPITVDLGGGLRFAAVPEDLLDDDKDNDGDLLEDEEDEEAIELRVTGRFRHARRTLVAYIRPMVRMPNIEAAASFQDFSATLDVNGNAFSIKGTDTAINGSPGAGAPQNGLAIVEPGNVANLLSGLSNAQLNKITGVGGAPSATTTTSALNIADLAGWALSVANNYVQPGNYSQFDKSFGNAAANDWQVTYCSGNLELSGNLSGAGVLVVNGDLTVTGTVNFIGLVVVTGNIVYKGGGTGYLVRGALLAGGNLELTGTVDIEYSSQAIQVVKETLTDKRVVTGWREVSN